MRRALLLAPVAVCALLAGCELVTGSTSGYTGESNDAGVTGPCLSARDCEGDAAICCLTVSAAGAGTSCNDTPVCPALPGAQPVQLCLRSAECPDASCTAQQCYWTGKAIPVLACGALPDCQPL